MRSLCGTYKHTIDKKKRMFLPAKLRADIGEQFVAAKHITAKCVALYPKEVWDEYEAELNALPRLSGEPIRRKAFSGAERLTVDEQGRILLPTELAAYAELEKNIVVIGVGSHAEVWSDVNRAAEEEKENSPELLEQIAALGL